jgi:Flp pilus assembly pilin Flp
MRTLHHLYGRALACLIQPGARLRREEGQTTAEYALVLLGACAIAVLIVMWAKSTGKLGDLFDTVVDKVISAAT